MRILFPINENCLIMILLFGVFDKTVYIRLYIVTSYLLGSFQGNMVLYMLIFLYSAWV